jgi:hypothetical protein
MFTQFYVSSNEINEERLFQKINPIKYIGFRGRDKTEKKKQQQILRV